MCACWYQLYFCWYDYSPDLCSTNNKTAAANVEGNHSDRASPLSYEKRMILFRLERERAVLQDRSSNPAIIHKKTFAWEALRKAFTAIN